MRMFGTGSETRQQNRQNIVYVYVNYSQSKGELASSFNKQDSFFLSRRLTRGLVLRLHWIPTFRGNWELGNIV